MRTPSLLAFPVASRFLNKYNAHPVNDKDTKYIRLVVELKIIQSLSACKNHSINLLDLSNHFWDPPDFRVPLLESNNY